MLRRALAVVSNTLEQHNRIFAIFFILRFAEDHVPGEPDSPVCFQRAVPKAITRCIDSLKSQLRIDICTGQAVHPAENESPGDNRVDKSHNSNTSDTTREYDDEQHHPLQNR